ncbi:DNA cytosine methyltransferase [Roseovarius nubinhibens]|uniref:DNA (cytosine-5-)-methyltransferase n=1 Tax=Roseovarius nubinhibens (strain ATCC BAA-591 / DSM 15170 / ISM) TaxID=89187 RepID=A3SKG8_ROSNI|nr:DNA cytosine methyltransferase [Roseovarius nubinhibens]EAP77849.1 modification methylase (Cytosine-specific methyltransferase [Roseovarius nubinhibens ISM]
MSSEYAIIDLFAGPGGLGEGFTQAGRAGDVSMKIQLSVEMEANAVQTLRLRSFLRRFGEEFPAEYYAALNKGVEFPNWSELYPEEWKHAEQEVRQLVLGDPGVFDEIAVVIDKVRTDFQGNTILIGGPPCQAYSLAGRSRNKGKEDYVLENDHRHYLYKEYVNILERLEPAAFVMENVKGMLSSKVDGGGIFHRVLEDLAGAGQGYTFIPLAAPPHLGSGQPPARDFILRAEDHGVPQARHRVIVVGVRKDVAEKLNFGEDPLLLRRDLRATVKEALSGIPRVRSGLSRGDQLEAWIDSVRDQAREISEAEEVSAELQKRARQIVTSDEFPSKRQSRDYSESYELPDDLKEWLLDCKLHAVLHHETRGHIPRDLGRYLFSSMFAEEHQRAPKLSEFPEFLQPNHKNRKTGHFSDRFRTQVSGRPSTTVTSHISKDGHYFIHPDPTQCRSLTVREAARLQTFPDNYFFHGGRTAQYHQVGNAVPPYLALQIASAVSSVLKQAGER